MRDYARSVDFQTGEATVHWADERGVFERRLFVSRKDGVAVLSIGGPQAGAVNCQLTLEPRRLSDKLEARQVERSNAVFQECVADIVAGADDLGLTYRNSFTKAYPGSIQALEGMARVISVGGMRSTEEKGTMVIKGADHVLILIDIRMLYEPEVSQLDEMRSSLASLPADYDKLLDGHAKIHGELFNRMRLDIGGGADHQRTTEELLERSSYEKPNRALIEKQFDAGRYNIISCTGELPPTLQGCWGGTYVPGWASDFTHNGNVPSAIAANMMGNMPELMLAYTSYIESLVPWLEINAKHMFGARGVVLPSRSTTNGFNNALAPDFAGGFWVGGAGWAAHFFYDYYLYTGDREFLAEHALPFMEKAALFFEDYLYEGPDGKFVFSPTQSPENTPGNSNSQGSFNATMDVAVAKELLTNLISASRELERNEDKIPLWQEMLDKMPEYMIDDNGIIKEWLTPRLENRDSHRHSSQLYPLFDGMPEEIAQSPELQAAFRKSIEYKLDKHWKNNQRGFMSFGLVQLGQAATSLGESELAYHCLRHLVNRFWLNNLASMHNHRSLFNMDISGGMPAVIIKMLVASDVGKIQLLPALPAAWPAGRIEGVLCRGAIEIRVPAVGREADRGHAEFSQVADDRTRTARRDLPTLHHPWCREGESCGPRRSAHACAPERTVGGDAHQAEIVLAGGDERPPRVNTGWTADEITARQTPSAGEALSRQRWREFGRCPARRRQPSRSLHAGQQGPLHARCRSVGHSGRTRQRWLAGQDLHSRGASNGLRLCHDAGRLRR